MAAPLKGGLEYFSFDVDFFNDEKIQFVSARFGTKGEIITIRLLCKIYRQGFFVFWDEDISILFAKSVGDGCQHSLVNDVVHELVRRGFFDRSIFDSFKILTSKGIQKRYFESCLRRKEVILDDDKYLLVDAKNYKNVTVKSRCIHLLSNCIHDVDINSVNVDINSKNVDINKQSKVKESKVKESKGKESKEYPQNHVFDFQSFHTLFLTAGPTEWLKFDYQSSLAWRNLFNQNPNQDPEELIESAKAFKEHCFKEKTASKFVKTPQRWLQDGCYLIDYKKLETPQELTEEEKDKKELERMMARCSKK